MTGNRFCRNIVYYSKRKAPLVLFEFVPLIKDILAQSASNIFFRPDGGEYIITEREVPPKTGIRKYSLAEWQEMGYNTDSVVADPLFVDAQHNDYRLKPESPAFRLGFMPIDVAKIGIRQQD